MARGTFRNAIDAGAIVRPGDGQGEKEEKVIPVESDNVSDSERFLRL